MKGIQDQKTASKLLNHCYTFKSKEQLQSCPTLVSTAGKKSFKVVDTSKKGIQEQKPASIGLDNCKKEQLQSH
jgi:hypothetical protein